MDIQIGPHTLERAKERGANKNEIFEVIKSGNPILAIRSLRQISDF